MYKPISIEEKSQKTWAVFTDPKVLLSSLKSVP